MKLEWGQRKGKTDRELRGCRGEANKIHVTWKQQGSYGAGSKRGSWDGERGGERDKSKVCVKMPK